MDQKLYHGIEDGRTICGPFVKFAPPLFFPYYLLFINSISMIHGLLIMSGGRPSEICQISQKRKKKKKRKITQKVGLVSLRIFAEQQFPKTMRHGAHTMEK
jgi:hypothetical protein